MQKWIFILFAFLLALTIFGLNLSALQWSSPENAVVVSAILTVLMVAAMDRSRYVWVSFLTLAIVVYILTGVLPKEEVAFYFATAAGQWILLGYVLHRSLAGAFAKLIFCLLVPVLLLPFILHNSNWLSKDFLQSSLVIGNTLLALTGIFLPLPPREQHEEGWNILALQHTILRFGVVYANLVLIDSATRQRMAQELSWPLVIVAALIFIVSLFRGTSFWDRTTLIINTLFVIALTLLISEQDLLITMAFIVAASAFVITPAYSATSGGWTAVLKPLESGGLGGISFVLASECCLQLVSSQMTIFGLAWLVLIFIMGSVVWLRAVGRLSLSKLIFEPRQLLQPRPLLHFLLLLLAAAAAVGSTHV